MAIKKIGVIGAGQMGNGIAHIFGLAGYSVVLQDVSKEQLNKAMKTIAFNLTRQVAKGAITAAVKKYLPATAQVNFSESTQSPVSKRSPDQVTLLWAPWATPD